MSEHDPARDMAGSRLDALTGRFAQLGIDALLIGGPANRHYLSGFTGSSGLLLIAPGERILVTDFRYTEQAARQAVGFSIVEASNLRDGLVEQAGAHSFERLGFEADHTTVAQHAALAEALGHLSAPPSLIALEGTVEEQRLVKDEGELDAIRRAVRIADDVMALAAEAVRPGVTERQVADLLESEMRRLGAPEPSFDTIVAAGPNAAMAHHSPADHPLDAGESVVVDLGVKVDGYCSDITRTFVVGSPTGRFSEMYDLVLSAQQAALDGIRAGMTGVEADALARDVIARAGHGERFGHGLGHGVGLEIHEGPRLSTHSTDLLRAGMVTSVEPGIYIPGWGGVRIEDLVVVREQGVEILSGAPK